MMQRPPRESGVATTWRCKLFGHVYGEWWHEQITGGQWRPCRREGCGIGQLRGPYRWEREAWGDADLGEDPGKPSITGA